MIDGLLCFLGGSNSNQAVCSSLLFPLLCLAWCPCFQAPRNFTRFVRHVVLMHLPDVNDSGLWQPLPLASVQGLNSRKPGSLLWVRRLMYGRGSGPQEEKKLIPSFSSFQFETKLDVNKKKKKREFLGGKKRHFAINVNVK